MEKEWKDDDQGNGNEYREKKMDETSRNNVERKHTKMKRENIRYNI